MKKLENLLGGGRTLLLFACVVALFVFNMGKVSGFVLGWLAGAFSVAASPWLYEKALAAWDWVVIRWSWWRQERALSPKSTKGDNVRGFAALPAFSRASIPSKLFWGGMVALLIVAGVKLIHNDGVRTGVQRERAIWQEAQARAILRGTTAQRDLDSNVNEHVANEEKSRAATRSRVQRAHEEINNAPDDSAAHAAYLRAWNELRERAKASAADAYSSHVASVVR